MESLGSIRRKNFKKPTNQSHRRHDTLSSLRKDDRSRVLGFKRVQCNTGEKYFEDAYTSIDDLKSDISQLNDSKVSLDDVIRKARKYVENSSYDADAFQSKTQEILGTDLKKFITVETMRTNPATVQAEIVHIIGLITGGEIGDTALVEEMIQILLDVFPLGTSDQVAHSAIALGNLAVDIEHQIPIDKIIPGITHTIKRFSTSCPQDTHNQWGWGPIQSVLFLLCTMLRGKHGNLVAETFQKDEGFTDIIHFLRGSCSGDTICELPVGHNRRVGVSEALWCLAYITSLNAKCCSVLLSIREDICNLLLLTQKVINNPPEELQSQYMQSIMFRWDPSHIQEVQRLSLDIISPTLKLLGNLVSEKEEENNVDFLNQLSTLLPKLLHSTHREIKTDSIILLTNICYSQSKAIDFCGNFIDDLRKLLAEERSYDIRREAAAFITTYAFLDIEITLPIVMNEFKTVIDMLDLLERSKYDYKTVGIVLDFLEGIMMYWEDGPNILLENNVIEIMETAQYLHDSATERRIAWIVEYYFD